MTWVGSLPPEKYNKTCSNLRHLLLNQVNKNDSGSYDRSGLHLNDLTEAVYELSLIFPIYKFCELQFDD